MMFIGSRHCPHCGAIASAVTQSELSVLKCPRCKIDMQSVTIGGEAMRECDRCGGLWLEVQAFERICSSQEQQSSVLGGALPAPASPLKPNVDFEKISYAPCPQCGQLMNRINFARCSGVVVDVCKGHGTWFDSEELREIVEFIRNGGLDLSRQKEKREIEYQRERLRIEELAAAHGAEVRRVTHSEFDRVLGISATTEILSFLIDH